MNICNAQKITEFSGFTRDQLNRSLTVNTNQDRPPDYSHDQWGSTAAKTPYPKTSKAPFLRGILSSFA